MPCDHIERETEQPVDTLCLPLTAQRETLGLLYFEMPDADIVRTSIPEIYFDMLAENIGLAIANLQLRDTLREMAMAGENVGRKKISRYHLWPRLRLNIQTASPSESATLSTRYSAVNVSVLTSTV